MKAVGDGADGRSRRLSYSVVRQRYYSVIPLHSWSALHLCEVMEHVRNRLTHPQDIVVLGHNIRSQRRHTSSISISAKPCVGVVMLEAESSRSVPFAAWIRSFRKPLK